MERDVLRCEKTYEAKVEDVHNAVTGHQRERQMPIACAGRRAREAITS